MYKMFGVVEITKLDASRRRLSSLVESKESEILQDSKVYDFFCPCLHQALLLQAEDVSTRFRAAGGTSIGDDSLHREGSAIIQTLFYIKPRSSS